MSETNLVNYNWGEYDFSQRDIQVLDTSLRDGLQDADLRHPTYAEKSEFVDELSRIGVNAVDIAIASARGPHLKDAIGLARQLPPNVDIVCLARTKEEDVKAALELAQGSGRAVEAIIFIGASRIRREVEGWDLDQMVDWMERSVSLATKEGIKANIATEHTTETEPEVIKRLYRAGLYSGGQKVCLADTTGAATPVSVTNLINFFKKEVLEGFDNIDIDWHGHDDRGASVTNSLIALEAGARRIHGTALGIGERAGNTPIEQLLLNLKIAGDPRRQDLTAIPDFAQFSSDIFGVPIRVNYPGIGEKVGMTASGIHASAMLKAQEAGLEPGSPYSIVNQRWFNRESSVKIGPLSGKSNVIWVAQKLGLEVSDELIHRALDVARDSNRVLSDQDLISIANSL